MKKSLLLIFLVALLVTSDDVKPADDACTCVKLMSENDCKAAKSGCSWTAGTPASGTTAATQGSCATTTTPTTPTVATYCSSVQDPATKCASTTGCAYVDSKCTHFTGCTAYVKATNADCQAISTLCITDGTQCTDAKSCNEYTVQTDCEANPSISGIKKCKWDNGACRDYVCTEAASTLTTNAECSAWLSGCVSTGKGCIQTLGACASYTGDDVACGGLKGTDGNCEGVANGTNCKARTCAGAAATLTTDTDCAAYQIGCVTNGKGCVTAPLPACASYSGDNTTCVGYIGSDGTCEGDAGATNCRARVCTNAPTSNNTDTLCAAYKAGCVTTGKGCIATKGACSSYSGTTTSCVGYIGTDGYCKGTNATTASPCAPKVCTEAPATTNTNAACATYQTGCVTTGKGCVSSLGPCSGYTGTTTTCDGYVGTDGKCKGTNPTTPGACAPKVCTEAPASTTTNEACAQYQTGCVTNGAGCVSLTSCINTIKQISCTGTSSCGWNNICVASANCSDFLTVSICLGNNAGTGASAKPCYWTGSACRDLACTDAPTTNNTDALCNTFLAGCVTKGNGCLAPTAPCSSYQGTQTTCAAFTRKCWNTSAATSTTACIERTCADDTTSTSDSACNTFKTNCRTKGTGCIDPTALCTAYQGTASQCDAFRGTNGTIRCWNTSTATATTACTVKACSDNTTATTDADCGTFLTGCVTNGAGCILKSAACSSYNGTQTTCATFKGTNGTKICWNTTAAAATSACKEKECSDAPNTLTTDADCGNFLSGCLTSGAGCKSPNETCSTYQGTLTQCAAFTGDSKKCYKSDACADRVCADKTTAANNTECTTYLSTCRYFKGACVNAAACNSYGGSSLADCQDALDNTAPTALKCWWVTGGTTCTSRTCANAPSSVASQTDCDNHITGCVYNGNNQCVTKGSCGSYTANGTSDTIKLNNCKIMNDTAGKVCWFVTGATTCTDKACNNAPTPVTSQSNCDAHKSGCQYNGTGCVDQGACNTYVAQGSTDALKLTNCKAMKNSSNQQCFWSTGQANCEDTTCSNAQSPQSQTDCDTHLSAKCLFKFACETRLCSGKTGATNQSDCTSWKSGCQWLGGTTCADKAANCAAVDLTGASSSATKKTVCEGVTTTAAVACQLNSANSACEDRTCAGASSISSTANCSSWKATCQWDGKSSSSCVDQSAATCAAIAIPSGTSVDADKAAFCSNYILTGGSAASCQLNSGKTACEDRTCLGATTMSSSANCSSWKATCQWDGVSSSSCVAQAASCAASTIPTAANTDALKSSFCNNVVITGGTTASCQLNTAKTACEDRTCAGATGMQNKDMCTSWKANCQWEAASNSSCMDQVTTCAAAAIPSGISDAFKDSFCKQFVLTGGTTTLCQLNSGKTACEDRTCAKGATMTSRAECNSWLANCQWDGKFSSSCVDQVATCAGATLPTVATTDAIKTAFCENFVITGGSAPSCQLNSAKTACEDRTCVGASSKSSAANCSSWKTTCQWDGVATSSCVAQAGTCAGATLPTAATTDAQKSAFCSNFVITGGSAASCQLNSGKTACEDRTCVGATGQTSSTTCSTWKTTCQWDGVASSSCVAQAGTCAGATLPTAATTDAQKSAFCSNFVITGGSAASCQLNSGKTACEDRTCVGATGQSSSTTCNTWKSGCQWDGVASSSCVAQASTCAGATLPTAATTDAQKSAFCSNFVITGGSAASCQLNSGKTACEDRTCSGATGQTSSTTCNTWKSGCQWDGNISCVDSSATCPKTFITSIHTTDIIRANYCENFSTTGSTTCQRGATGTGCSDRTCDNIQNATSNTDCSNWLSTCVFIGSGCATKTACSSYTPTGTDNAAKRTICTSITDTSGNACVFVDNASSCASRDCTNVYPTPATKSTCESWMTSCRWINSACAAAIGCSSIDAQGSDDATKLTYCSDIKDNSSTPVLCTYHSSTSSTKCSSRTCANNPNTPTSATDCSTYLSTCTISNPSTAVCVDKSSACSAFTGTAAQCKTFSGVNGTKPCWSISTASTPAACIDKACSHNTTATSDLECNDFLAGCKTNGSGCIDSTTACSTFQGNSTTCVIRKAGDNTNYCKVGASTSGPCKDKSCYDDASSTTDSQCQAFMSTCLTNGAGCIPKTEPCSSYRGTQTTCAAFTGSSGANKCWNTSTATATTACVNKKCSDDTTSNTDTACGSIIGCITKGTGCIEKTAACSAYTGTQSGCSAFKGNNGTVPCWNTQAATATTACVDKACTHNTTATTDADCNTFLPKASGSTTPKCVTDGAGCQAYPRTCSQFTGTTEKCGTFTASDGPCKSTVTTGSGPCTPRICTEALNTNNTDALCKAYHPTCVTTGYGCATSVSCSNVTDQNACTAKTGCSWVNNCRSIGNDCSALTANGASICVNTPVTTGQKKCAWYNNACRAVTCEDLSDGLKTDDACKAQLSTCTTKGEGCITRGACSTYSSETICKAAKTNDAGDTCIWDSNACRAKKCTDATTGATTDEGCNTFLAGCKTNGSTCISSGFNCTSLITNAACLKDGSNKPCLWVNSVCYNYVKCEDITMTTHSACQAFSPLCTTDGTKCIAISSCAKTSLQVSCVTGTDGTCGWLPAAGANAAKCQKFGACSDAVSADKATCQAYGSSCITDGTKCIDKGTCSTYTTQIACETNGTDGTCIFSSNACRLRECSDATASNATAITTHAGCQSFSAKDKCTTNGTSCIPLSTCSSYTIEAGCELGTDGICTWSLPVGTTTSTTKSCRLKVCQDFTLTTSAACSSALTGAGVGTGCVSNGTNCIAKAACQSYTTKEACNGGGTDGLCAFTAGSTTTPNVGTCKLMSQCSDANNDSVACAAKSAVCNWKVTTSGSTTTSACNAHDCTTKASGTDCNPVPSFDGLTYSICIPSTTSTCVLGTGTSLTLATCYGKSLGTYTWNAQTNLCTACFTRTNTGGVTNGSTNTGSTYESLIHTVAILLIMASMVA